jgi:hypothetical protein
MLFTQSAGEIVLPPIRVRFQAKDSLEGEEQSVEGRTPQLHFTSRRPPGTEAMDAVVATTGMEIVQDWTPADLGRIEPGDVIERIVTRRASRTTAMMLPELELRGPAGVRIYPGPPVVRDRLERGEFTAERIDTLKYQFERSGRYELPALSFAWWDPATQSLQQDDLEGREIRVGGAIASRVPASMWNRPPALQLGILAILALLALIAGRAVAGLHRRWYARGADAERMAASAVRTACRAGDARGAYAALLRWRGIVMRDAPAAGLAGAAISPEEAALRKEVNALAARNFSAVQADPGWDGSRLWRVFLRLRRRLRWSAGTNGPQPQLPPLNP